MIPTPADMILYRGEQRETFDDFNKIKIGTLIHNDAFSSYSTSFGVAKKFSNKKGYIIRLFLPKGSKALYFTFKYYTSNVGEERELLLPSGINLQVLDKYTIYETDGSRLNIINCHILGYGQKELTLDHSIDSKYDDLVNYIKYKPNSLFYYTSDINNDQYHVLYTSYNITLPDDIDIDIYNNSEFPNLDYQMDEYENVYVYRDYILGNLQLYEISAENLDEIMRKIEINYSHFQITIGNLDPNHTISKYGYVDELVSESFQDQSPIYVKSKNVNAVGLISYLVEPNLLLLIDGYNVTYTNLMDKIKQAR